jgi:hypothetical protein
MSPTSYQAAPPRIKLSGEGSSPVVAGRQGADSVRRKPGSGGSGGRAFGFFLTCSESLRVTASKCSVVVGEWPILVSRDYPIADAAIAGACTRWREGEMTCGVTSGHCRVGSE